MQTKEELAKLYSTFSDRKLLDIIDDKDQYTELALNAASEEIQKRKINSGQLREYVETKIIDAKISDHVASLELTFFEKVKFFFAWFLPFFMEAAFRMNLAEAGLATKVKQSRIFSIAGFVCLMLTGFLAVKLEHSNVESILLLLSFFGVVYLTEKRFRKQAK